MIKTARLYLFPLLLTISLFADNSRTEAFYASNEIDIYDVSSHKGLKGSLDTRMLTKDGWKDIKEDLERSKRLGQAIGDVATNDAFQLQDTFAHIDETQKDLDVQKAFALANGGKNVEALQGGEGVSMEEKQAAIKSYAEIYAKVYKVTLESANIIATNKIIYGTSYANNGTSIIDINDNAQRNATDYVSSLTHEGTHARIAQNTTRDRGTDALNEQYADTMGEYSADGLQFSSGTYNNVTLDRNDTTNTHTVTATDQTLLANNNANWRTNVLRSATGDGTIEYRLTKEQEAQRAQEIAQCQSDLCREVKKAKFDIVSSVQGTAEVVGTFYGTGEQVVNDTVELVKLANDLYENPQKAEDEAVRIKATLTRYKEIVQGSQMTEQEQQEVLQLVQEIGNDFDAMMQDAASLDGEGLAASFNEGKKTGAILATVVGIGKLNKFLKGVKKLDNVDGPNAKPTVAERQGLHDPNQMRADIEDVFGAENVTSTTNPKKPVQRVNSNPEKGVEVINGVNGSKAVKVTYSDPVTGNPVNANIPYNERGLPIFDDHAKFTTKIDKTKSPTAQMSQATRDLRDAINRKEVDTSQFTPAQLQDIKGGKRNIVDLTWHHNAVSNNMQLVPTDLHEPVSHIGETALSKGK